MRKRIKRKREREIVKRDEEKKYLSESFTINAAVSVFIFSFLSFEKWGSFRGETHSPPSPPVIGENKLVLLMQVERK